MELEFPASPARLGELRRAVRAGLHGVVPEADLDDLVLALNEAATNAILYGSGGGRPVQVIVQVDGDWAEVTVLDHGAGPAHGRSMRFPAEPDPETVPAGGRGLWLMGRLVDEVRLERVELGAGLGTRVTLRRRLTQRA